MSYKVLLAERATGIVANADGLSWHLTGMASPYSYFDSLSQAVAFATSRVEFLPTLEATIWDEADEYERTIIGESA